MPDNYIEISNLNPLNFIDVNRSMPANYHFKHFDKWTSREQILPFETAPSFHQKWQKDDIIYLQVKTNFGPVVAYILDENGVVIGDFVFDQVGAVGSDIYREANIALDGLATGCYKIKITAGDPVQTTLESECFFVADSHPDTLLFKYQNAFNNEVFYESGIYYLIRLDGCISDFVPTGTRVVYIDQPQNSKTVKGVSSRQFKLYIGGPEGCPNYIADKIQRIFDQTSVEIDGVGFSAIEGAKLTPKRQEEYAFAGWSLDISPTVNRGSKIFTSTGIQDRKIIMDVSVNTKLFGPIVGNANDNTITINELQ
jgi:hypothetical protein